MREFLQLDLAAGLTLAAASVTLALLGAFLVLQRRAMLGDALSHAALPGLVVAWIVTGSRGVGPMFAGALAAGLLTSALVAVVARYGRVERGAALGVVFTALFALGVLLIETSGARQVDLDVGCVLSGQLELLVWPELGQPSDLLAPVVWRTVPHAVPAQAAVLLATLVFLAAARRPLTLATFDPRFAAAVGAHPRLVSGALYGLVTLAVVAAFEAVGSILTVGLLVAPAATVQLARPRRWELGPMLVRAAGVGLATAVLGYGLATRGGPLVGLGALDVAGTVATLGGVGVAAAALAGRRRARRARDTARGTPGPKR